MSNSEVMTTQQAADYLQVSNQTLERWRRLKKGPLYIKMGKAVRYRLADLDAWLADSTIERGS